MISNEEIGWGFILLAVAVAIVAGWLILNDNRSLRHHQEHHSYCSYCGKTNSIYPNQEDPYTKDLYLVWGCSDAIVNHDDRHDFFILDTRTRYNGRTGDSNR